MKFGLLLLLAAAWCTAPVAQAADHHDKRYYDARHKDYHVWNQGEEKNFGVYLGEKHATVHPWAKARPRERQRYWNWKHQHEQHEHHQ